ncbi:MAG TPA: DUF4041 domain-containing protein [Flexivirga sp.]|uniref:DUF4041 domain-containing protein n=1 Tax=Flexivirga sp. TaxID=1962927 RepID=UPI002D0B8AAE|nr:DUF4041 domain-containing protein [Flexivirga sp.]HWC24647.1 DUF4041 domain-containing protein [Flexivirga sp.]
MAWGDGKRVGQLEAEVANLRQWVAQLQGMDAVTLASQIAQMRQDLAVLQAEAAAAKQAANAAQAEERAARAQLVEDLEAAEVQEAGFYTFNHPLQDAVAYKDALTQTQTQMKQLIKAKRAVEATTNWQVNGSSSKGAAMVRDFSKLLLRAYNSEADALVRALRPHTLDSAKGRLDKAATAIERLGKSMSIRISPAYHRLRFRELELTADYLVKKQQEKEAERDQRAQLRDEAKARAEMEAALVKLRKEQQHYQQLMQRLDPSDEDGLAVAREKLAEIGQSIEGVEARAANTRAGHVYVISNIGAFGPDMVKIGMTRRLEPMDRVIELGDASVPFRFDVHALVFHQDAVALETHLHQALEHRKVNQINTRREFFYAKPSEVRTLLEKYAGSFLLEYKEVPDALEWHGSGSVQRATPPRSDQPVPVMAAELNGTPTAEPVKAAVASRFDGPPPDGDPEAKAAWYVSPDDQALWRRWDGSGWTEETKQR